MRSISPADYCMCCKGNLKENGKYSPLIRTACPTWIQYKVDCRYRNNKGIRTAKLFPDDITRVFAGGPENCSKEEALTQSKIIISRISNEELNIELPDIVYKSESKDIF